MTMKELAEYAGVSVSAISRYLNGGSLSQDKRDLIRKAMEETGYQPDTVAQMLRNKVTDHIGLIIPKLDSDAVTRMTRGATQVLSQAGYLGLLADTGNDPDSEIAYLKLFQNRSVAGIIFMATVFTPQHEELLRNSDVPIVVVGQQFRGVPCVFHNDHDAAYDLTRLVLAKGRRHMAFIGVSEKDVAVGVNRRRGVEDAMRDCGLDPASLIVGITEFTVDGGRDTMEILLAEHPEIDGLLCVTDRIAFGAMEVLRQHGKSVPGDVSVVGMDDNWAAEHIEPHLTSSHFYYKTSGEVAAEHLLSLIKNKNVGGPVQQTMIGYSIVERDSV